MHRSESSTRWLQNALFEGPPIPIDKHLEAKNYIRLILEAQKISGLSLQQIQFAFCLKDKNNKLLKGSSIQAAINAFLKDDTAIAEFFKGKTQKEIEALKNELKNLNLPENPTKLHAYVTTLQLRGESFSAAANKIIANLPISPAKKDVYKEQIKNLTDLYLEKMKQENLPPEKAQAYYDAFIDSLKFIIKPEFPKKNDKALSKCLQNAETLCNMTERKAQFTFTGKALPDERVHLQMDEPRNRFCDFAAEQKNEWIKTYWAYLIEKDVKEKILMQVMAAIDKNPNLKDQEEEILAHIVLTMPAMIKESIDELDDEARAEIINKHVKVPEWMIEKSEYNSVVFAANENKNDFLKLPKWFAKLEDWEKEDWMRTMDEIMKSGNDEMCMGPVVKKNGVPGLRNAALSSYATIEFKDDSLKTSVSPQSVRSSNLIVGKEASKTFYEEQTADNIRQVGHLYKTMRETPKEAFPWEWSKVHTPITLCQTLLRMKGGGDDHVIDNKNKVAETLNGENTFVFTSNHCIGTPNKVIFLALSMMGSNTKGNEHITKPIQDFIDNAVIPTLTSQITDKKNEQTIRNAFCNAQLGKFTGFKKQDLADLTEPQKKSLTRIFSALNEYVNVDKEKNYKQNYQLHEAALEEIIYQYTGNRIQSSCKSGKDREGILKCYRNAMLAYFDETGTFPPLNADARGRKHFVELFMEFFKSNHQARLAELNAAGCNGLKALKNILPYDIYQAVKESGLLTQHKQNSSLNELGKAAVKRDEATYQEAKNDLHLNLTGTKEEQKRSSQASEPNWVNASTYHN